MWRKIFISLIVFLGTVLSSSAEAGNIIQEMIDRLNQIRFSQGRQQLWFTESLSRAAESHAADMAKRNYFSHFTPEGWSVQMRAEGWGWPNWALVSEILGASSANPDYIAYMWMQSDGHRGQILDGRYNQVGIAHHFNSYSSLQHYWVVVFGAR